MNFNWPKFAMIEPRGTMLSVYVFDAFEMLKLKMIKAEKKSRTLESFIPFALTQQKLSKRKK